MESDSVDHARAVSDGGAQFYVDMEDEWGAAALVRFGLSGTEWTRSRAVDMKPGCRCWSGM